MSEWYEVKDAEDVELDGEEINILFDTNHAGNRYVTVPVRMIAAVIPDNAALREEVERLRVRVEVLGAMLYEINSMNDTANLNDAELWNVNGETQNRIDVLLKSVDLKGE